MTGTASVAMLLAFVAIPFAARDAAATVAQQDTIPCDGQTINSIVVRTLPPAAIARSSSAIRRTLLRIAFQSSTTDEEVVRSFLLVRTGERCNARRLAEAERVLRIQPFISSASIRTFADTGAGVRLEVETLDEIPVVIGGSLSGGLSAVKLGNANIGGNGLHAAASWRNGDFYRDGFALEVRKYGLANQPLVLSINADRKPLGHDYSVTLQQPFFSNMQRVGLHAGLRDVETYETFVREAQDAVSLQMKRLQWSAGAVARVGGRNIGLFAGPIAMFERIRPAENSVVVSDSGILAPDTDELLDRYASTTTFRVGAVAGIRVLSYARVAGFDALLGEQDIARGFQVGATAARGINALGASGLDDFASLDAYAGVGGGRTLAAFRGNVEGQRGQESGEWSSVVASGRAAAYFKPSERRTWELSLEYSAAWRESIPMQLSLGQRGGGPRGYEGDALPGARRVVGRFEERRAMGAVGRYMHWGLAAFVDGAKIWSGAAPFSSDLNGRASVGVALLAALPPQSRRLLRLDLAVPLTRDARDSWSVSFSARDLTRFFWREPRDLSRSRSASLPASLFGWP